MKRNAFSQLVKWKNNPERKPLIIRGARQVGKTWLMKEFGQTCYESYVYFNFDEEDELKSIFETNKNPQRIIELLSLIAGEKILPGETLVIFDEVQECPEALNTLKYFKEKTNDYHVIAAGSLLGTLLAQPKSYPVGMVNLLDLYPLCFDEFLEATDPALFAYYESIQKDQTIEEIFHNRLLEAYNNYLIIGGMPECVASWIKYKDPAKINQSPSGITAGIVRHMDVPQPFSTAYHMRNVSCSSSQAVGTSTSSAVDAVRALTLSSMNAARAIQRNFFSIHVSPKDVVGSQDGGGVPPE